MKKASAYVLIHLIHFVVWGQVPTVFLLGQHLSGRAEGSTQRHRCIEGPVRHGARSP